MVAGAEIARSPHRFHPRRFGFAIFNVVVAVLMALWISLRSFDAEAGLAGLPNFILTSVGIVVLGAVWVGSWIAWGTMVWSRHRAHADQTETSSPPASAP